jgi:type I restriction enzyme M protein
VDEPHIFYDNSLKRNVREYSDEEKFDVIIMNPPYGGTGGVWAPGIGFDSR